ncbi:diguanylate cyclase [Vibrio sp. SCSIO 43136]|uniref:diguanylate cyclase n=1 Tax=Vibrio sp. SCSIO 43136 TaxID=2819101 RepID=UPI0020751642|nr:diguanylate cyclase [Vibrio sp. SCSIO 43136]USD66497.1 GGDEF domain-containing protein [Vibrio sp. SCSIO 43136]
MKKLLKTSLLLTSLLTPLSHAFDRDTWIERYHAYQKSEPNKAIEMLEQRYLALPEGGEKLYISSLIQQFFTLRGQPYYFEANANPTQFERFKESLIAALNHETQGEYQQALNRYKVDLATSKSQLVPSVTTVIEYRLCNLLSRMGEYHNAKFYCTNTLTYLSEQQDPFIPLHIVHRLLAMNYSELGDIKLALEFYNHALESTPSKLLDSGLYNDIGNLLAKVGNFSEAERYLTLAFDLTNQEGVLAIEQAQVLHSLAELYLHMDKLELAQEYFELSLEKLKPTQYAFGMANVYIGLGKLHTKLNNHSLSNAYLHQAMTIASKMKNNAMQTEIALSLSQAYWTLDILPVSLEYAQQAQEAAYDNDIHHLKVSSEKLLSELYEANGDTQRAFEHYRNYHQLSIAMHHDENRTAYEALDLNRARLQEELKRSKLLQDNHEKQLEIVNLYKTQELYQFALFCLAILLIATYKIHTKSRRLAQYDSLTNTLSRIGTLSRVRQQKEPSLEGCYNVLALFDLDNFKQVNDSYGHPTGDLALLHVTQVINESLERGDFIGRLGGEEFLVLMKNVAEGDAAHRVESLRASISNSQFTSEDNLDVNVTASFAFLATKEALNDFDVLYSILDQALYQAKLNGRDCIVDAYHDPIDIMPYSAAR